MTMRMHPDCRTLQTARGFSLVEMMTALAIGVLLLLGLTTVFSNSSNSNRELKRTAEQIENGRFAIELLTQDLRHAGFYGELTKLPAAPGAAPDPCTVPSDALVSDTVNNFIALPVQVYPASNFSTAPTVPTLCAALLPSANVMVGSDIVIVRRTDTNTLGTSVTGNTYYLQTSATSADMQKGVSGTITTSQNARGATSAIALKRFDFSAGTSGSPATYPQISAYMRRYRTHIYFVAPCSVPNGGGSVCTGSADDQGTPIPTLKRIELDTTGAFSITPLVEGIQAIRLEVGIDNSPATADPGTGLIGDGIPDSYSHSPSLAEMTNITGVRIYVLARNTSKTPGYTDTKTYTLGSVPTIAAATTTAASDGYKRHAYAAETQIKNQAGRREIPQ